jgi:hypothetical protein
LLEELTRAMNSCHEYRANPDYSAAAFCSLVKVPKLTNAAPTQITCIRIPGRKLEKPQ